MELLDILFVAPFVDMASSPVFFAEVVITGLLTGIMYSLVALGFVLIFILQVLFIYASDLAGVEDGDVNRQDIYEKMLPVLLICDAFPFVLWILIAKDFVREMTTKIFQTKPS